MVDEDPWGSPRQPTKSWLGLKSVSWQALAGRRPTSLRVFSPRQQPTTAAVASPRAPANADVSAVDGWALDTLTDLHSIATTLYDGGLGILSTAGTVWARLTRRQQRDYAKGFAKLSHVAARARRRVLMRRLLLWKLVTDRDAAFAARSRGSLTFVTPARDGWAGTGSDAAASPEPATSMAEWLRAASEPAPAYAPEAAPVTAPWRRLLQRLPRCAWRRLRPRPRSWALSCKST